jgi:hypothetical protein
MVAEIKQEIPSEMGLLPVHLLRERRSSFVELYAYDNDGQTNYGTAGYLGRGYFVTVKHAVVALNGGDERGARKIGSVKVVYKGEEIPARVIDTGDADVEVHSGDWAIIKTKELDLPALHVDTSFAYDFADPIFRLGNDYRQNGTWHGTGRAAVVRLSPTLPSNAARWRRLARGAVERLHQPARRASQAEVC